MSPPEILNPHAEAEIEKALRLELIWFANAIPLANLEEFRIHSRRVAGLLYDLKVERFVNSQRRVPDNKLSRSWHR